ncbi:arylsulfatase [Nocardia sp. MDA0666]|uniref:arylsulfatase n=1 Tax=Nocardia sp. MDA0666 TaxID=2135448 RepID=UPI000D13D0A9|nr:arylsulfatase [Nocardia sp. MDA0666]PSR68859.1 arylsulfatase [Nocardia sp. MDA0666]
MAAEFAGKIERDVRDSVPDWTPFVEPRAPEGAPNVLYVVWDDMGFGSWDLYGGSIEMPAMRRIAERGVQFTQFHTTALCSPTRASLLTGRNATSNGMAVVGEISDGFPNMSCYIPPENGFISEVLRERGYNTMAVGKWHLSPASEMSMGASKRTWPLARGFDRFYGFLGGLTDQWYPDLWYDNHQIDPPAAPAQGYHLSADLADRAMEFIADSLATAPNKPWMMYFCPGACHAPHHVFREWADKYKGVFDDGYEHCRERVLERQKELGLLPPGTVLPDINPLAQATSAEGLPWPASDLVIPWHELSEGERRLFARQAEVYAGFASYTDHQIGRLLDYLEQIGQLDNTVIVALSDNGCSAEGGPQGSVNENRWYNQIPENVEENLAKLGELGTETTHPHFSNGWAMAFNTPFKLYKMNAAWEGGTADPLLVSWPSGLPARGTMCDKYIHAIDIVPTLYDLLGVTAPDTVRSVPQSRLEGESMAAILRDPASPSPKHTQFYSMMGTRAIWRDGWQANTVHAPAPNGWGHFDRDTWCLYHLDVDRNQMRDLADEQPHLLAELIALWEQQAEQYNGYPLDDRTGMEIANLERPSIADDTGRITLFPGGSEVPERSFVMIGRSFAITASLDIQGEGCAGVIFAGGGRFGGHSLFVKDHRLHYVYNWLGEKEQHLVSDRVLATGPVRVGVEFVKTGVEGHSPTGTAQLYIGGDVVAKADIMIQPMFFSLSGEGMNVGRDRGQPVSSEYRSPFELTGARLDRVVIQTGDDIGIDLQVATEAAYRRD